MSAMKKWQPTEVMLNVSSNRNKAGSI